MEPVFPDLLKSQPMKNISIALIAVCFAIPPISAPAADYTGDVTAVCTVRSVEQQPGAALLWEPSIAVWKPEYLVVSFGAGVPGKIDMGDVFAGVSANDGETWSEPVLVFDHNQRYGEFCNSPTRIRCSTNRRGRTCCGASPCVAPTNYQDSEDLAPGGRVQRRRRDSWTPGGAGHALHGSADHRQRRHLPHSGKRPAAAYLLPANPARGVTTRSARRAVRAEQHQPAGMAAGRLRAAAARRPGVPPGRKPCPRRRRRPVEARDASTADYERENKALEPPRAFSSVSNDGGRTWSPAQQEPDLWNNSAKAYYGRASDGTHLYVYSATAGAEPDGLVRYKTQPAGGTGRPNSPSTTPASTIPIPR